MNRFKNVSVYKIFTITFLICCIINFPTLFSFAIRNDSDIVQALNDYNTTVQFTYCVTPPFFETMYGKLLLAIIAFIRDFLALIVEIVVAVVSIYFYVNYQETKRRTVELSDPTQNTNDTTNRNNILSNIERGVIQQTLSKASKRRMDRLNNSLTNMTIYLTGFSITCNVITFLYVILYVTTKNLDIYEYYLIALSYLILALRHTINFFFYYFYNYRFKYSFHKLMKKII